VNPEERLFKALRSDNPGDALRTLVVTLAKEGRTRQQIYDLLEQFLVRMRTRSDYRESEEEFLLDTLDALTGWCHPDSRLLAEESPAAGQKPPE
jgi:hypothetical protein